MPGELALAEVRGTPARDLTIDVARGIAIILVVLGHNRALNGAWPAFVDALFLFHVPLFFLLSGRVLRPEHPPRAAPKLALRLLLPFAIAALLVGAVKCAMRGESPGETLSGILWATGQTLPWSHLWFLPALFLALLATHAVALVAHRASHWAVAVVLAVVVSAVIALTTGLLAGPVFPAPVGWPWSLDLLPLCLVFVWAGQWLRSSEGAQRAIAHPVTVLLAAVAFAFAVDIAHVDLNMRIFAPFAVALAAAFAGCVVTLKISQWLGAVAQVARPLALIGRHTLVIFILHVSLQKMLLGLFHGVPLSGAALGVLGIASAAATIAITLLISLAIDHLRARRSGAQGVAHWGTR